MGRRYKSPRVEELKKYVNKQADRVLDGRDERVRERFIFAMEHVHMGHGDSKEVAETKAREDFTKYRAGFSVGDIQLLRRLRGK